MTPWSAQDEARARDSDTAHAVAQRLIYPEIFGVSHTALSFEAVHKPDSEHSRILDAEMGVDRVVYVSVDGLRSPLKFTVQERFRSPEAAQWQDLTITEWYTNSAGGSPAELYRINAGLFVYGYYDKEKDEFLDVIAVDTAAMLRGIVQGVLRYDRGRNKRNQTFIAIKFSELERNGVVVWRMPRRRIA